MRKSVKVKVKSITLSRKQIGERLAHQKLERKFSARIEKAKHAIAVFRPRKADRGQILLVSTKGKRDPQIQGNKGYPVYITKTGKKRLVKEYGKAPEKIFLPVKISELEFEESKYLRNARKAFSIRRKVEISRHVTAPARWNMMEKPASKRALSMGGNSDAINKLADTLKRRMDAQASHRRFAVDGKVLVKLPSGNFRVYDFSTIIERGDHTEIRVAGVRNFIKRRFYRALAESLRYEGYVTSGSANHIRNLPVNKGKAERVWETKSGKLWPGRGLEIVEIHKIEWRFSQIK